MPPLISLSNFEEILYKLSLLSAFLTGFVCKILKLLLYMATNIARCPKKSICCLINNRTKDFCQNFNISRIMVKKHLLTSVEN